MRTITRSLSLLKRFFKTNQKEGSEHEPLNINSKEKHFEYLKEIKYLRITEGKVLRIVNYYKLDQEHGLEIKLADNKIEDIGDIAET